MEHVYANVKSGKVEPNMNDPLDRGLHTLHTVKWWAGGGASASERPLKEAKSYNMGSKFKNLLRNYNHYHLTLSRLF